MTTQGMQETGVSSLGQEYPLELETVTHSSTFAWRITLFFFFFWLCWIFVTLHRLSLDAASEGYSSCNALHCIAVSILVAEHARALGVRTTVVVARVLSNYRPRFAAP